ncbi:MAG: PQQ-dependent sugar dehydrogenase [Betaproteobacteria bacterium]
MKTVASALRIRLGGVDDSGAFWALWHIAALLLVVLAPSHLYLRVPFWRLTANQISQGLLMGAAYLALALFLRLSSGHRARLVSGAAASVLCFGSGYLFLLARPDLDASRVLILISAVLGALLAFLPYSLYRYRLPGLFALATATIAFVAIGIISPKGKLPVGPTDRVFATALNALSVTHLRNLLDPVKENGGGITRYDDGFLLATGSGEIYRLQWESGKNALKALRIPLSAPMDRKTFLADHPVELRRLRLRVTDIALGNSGDSTKIYLAHQHWNPEGKCFTMRVSAAQLPDRVPKLPVGRPDWTTVFESQPCLTPSPGDDLESGGRLAWTRDGRLLLTLGDFGFTGLVGPPAMAQAEDNDYGKVLLLDLAGGREIFTKGHRNPQGLFVDRQGRFWETEHGPQGGDELNLLHRGKNYGWPFLTYGTDYGSTYWPISKPVDGKLYEEPVHAFTPSIAISNLIELSGSAMFPEWEGDLLVASLRLQSLYRVRLSGDRVVYVEPIEIGRRIRDVEQGKDGRIVLWTDEGDIVVLASAVRNTEGARLYGLCSRCHEPIANANPLGPRLRRVVGMSVAAQPGYAYSSALSRLGGSWTDERLDAFLGNPAAYAPGTSMDFAGIPDAADRKALIRYLKSLR